MVKNLQSTLDKEQIPRLNSSFVTYFICFTIVLFPDSPAPEEDENRELDRNILLKKQQLQNKTTEEKSRKRSRRFLVQAQLWKKLGNCSGSREQLPGHRQSTTNLPLSKAMNPQNAHIEPC